MTPEDKIEFKQYIHDAISGYHAKVDAQNTVTNIKLETINKHLEKQNGRIGNAEKAIAMALEERSGNRQQQSEYRERVVDLEDKVDSLDKKELLHITNCPNVPRIQKLEEDKLMKVGVKQFMIGTVGLISIMLGIAFTSVKIAEYFNQQNQEKLIETIKKEIHEDSR